MLQRLYNWKHIWNCKQSRLFSCQC